MAMENLRRWLPAIPGRGSFRGLLAWGLAATILVLVANVVLLAVFARMPTGTSNGSRLLFRGDCSYASSRSALAHLSINALASILLSASNAAMQCLTAPTRADIDRAHKWGTHLDIGIASLRNLWRMDHVRQRAWCTLLVTSLLLHLMYNSVFLQSAQASAYNTLLVSQDFLTEAWNDSGTHAIAAKQLFGIPSNITKNIQSEVHTYNNLSFADCSSNYGAPMVENWANLVVVTNATTMDHSPTNSSVIASFWMVPNTTSKSSNLFSTPGGYVGFNGYNNTRDVIMAISGPSFSIDPEDLLFYSNEILTYQMLYCFAQPIRENICTIELFQPFLITVIVVNMVQVICLASMLYGFRTVEPLVTFGDAVASFVARPDPFTASLSGRPVAHDYRKQLQARATQGIAKNTAGINYQEDPEEPHYWKTSPTPWIRAVTTHQLLLAFFMYVPNLPSIMNLVDLLYSCIILLVLAAMYISKGVHYTLRWENRDGTSSFGIRDILATGLGKIYPQETFPTTQKNGLEINSILANVPQVIMSVLFLNYNQFFTVMFVSAEAKSFSQRRQFLRVSQPRGQQRSSYWLGLPFYCGVPILIVFAFQHWALSQTIFAGDINIMSPAQQDAGVQKISVVGYSIVGAIIVTTVGAVMLIVFLLVGVCRWFPAGMPLLSSNSIAISAACHASDRPRKEGEDRRPEGGSSESEAPLKYGVITKTGREAREYVGFSSGEVQPLTHGWIYGPPNPYGQSRAAYATDRVEFYYWNYL